MADKLKSAKPPNILVCCEPDKLDSWKTAILDCVADDLFTVYKLEQCNNSLWMDNSILIVIDTNEITANHVRDMNVFWRNGGKVLCFCPKMVRSMLSETAQTLELSDGAVSISIPGNENNVTVTVNNPLYKIEPNEEVDLEILLHSIDGKVPVFVQAKKKSKDVSEGAALVSQVRFDYKLETALLSYLLKKLGISCKTSPSGHLQETANSSLYLITSDHDTRSKFVEYVKPHLKKDNILAGKQMQMQILFEDDVSSTLQPKKEMFLVIASANQPCEGTFFDRNLYFDSLTTKHLGRIVLFSERITSTMDVVDRDGLPHGLVCVARRQTRGKGRSGNFWLSPEGCAMFSAIVTFAKNSKMICHLPMVQHIAALSMVEAIRNVPGYHDLDVRIKWPNDIYFGSGVKLGGVIVNSTMSANHVVCTIGCGINVSNAAPTICLNELMKSMSICSSEPEPPVIRDLSSEQVIALTLNRLEENLEAFEIKGPPAILPSYYDKWLHSGQEITLTKDGTATKAKVVGLDDFGFLTVVPEGSNTLQSVHPDGNTFDMTRNLVLPKTA